MSASKPSPTRSHGAAPSKRRSSRRTRSVCSASSNTSISLTAVVEDSFLSCPNGMSVLNDRTDIQEQPGRQSWWKRIGENSRRVTDIMEERDADVVRTINVAEEFDVEVLSQENENVSVDLPESSDGESIHSIVIPKRKMFIQQEDRHPQRKTKDFIRNKENLVNLQKSYFDKTNDMNIEQYIVVMPKKLFNAAPRTKPTFTAALINASPNKAVNKGPEIPAQEVQVRDLFSNRPNAKRKNNFAAFLLSDSEDEIPDVQPKRLFVFQKAKRIENQQISKLQRRSESQSSVRSSVSNMTDVDMEQWKHLPSSTMLEDQFELTGSTPTNRIRRLSRQSKSRLSEVATRQSNSINKSNQSHKSDKLNQTMKSSQSIQSNANVHKTILTEEKMQIDDENLTLKYDDDDEQIFDIPGKSGNKNQEEDVREEERKEIQQDKNQIQGEKVSDKEKQEETNSTQETVQKNVTDQEIEEEDESEQEIVKENEGEQDFEKENVSEKEMEEEEDESEQEVVEENEGEQDIENENESEQEIEEENRSEQELEEDESDQEIEEDDKEVEFESNQENIEEQRKEQKQNQIQFELVTENQAGNKSEQEVIEENNSRKHQEEEPNEEEINNKPKKYIQSAQIMNNSNENNIVVESVENKTCEKNNIHILNQKEYQKLECHEKSAQECDTYVDKENVNLNENTQTNREIVSNNEDRQENINSNKNKEVDRENEGNIENEQDDKFLEAALRDKTKLSLIPSRESSTYGSLNLSAEGSGWDSHRTTRRTLRQTFGKDFTPRKSLHTLVMKRAVKQQAEKQNNEITDVSRQPIELKDIAQTNFDDITSKIPLANSTEFPAFESYQEDETSSTSSDRIPERSKMAIVNSSKLRESHKDKEQGQESDAVREQDKDEHIESGRGPEQDEEIEPGTQQDEDIESGTAQNKEIEPDTAQDEDIEPDTEQNEENESDEAEDDEELELEIESDRENHQTEDMETDGEQESDEDIDSNRGEEIVDEFESYREPEGNQEESDAEISIVQKILRENAEKRRKIEEQVMSSLKQGRKPFNLFKMPEIPRQTRITKIKKPPKAKPKQSPFFTGTLPPEFLEDMKYKPPKRFTGKNTPWITKRLYKYLEEKLEPKYNYRARVRAECLVEKLYFFAKDARKRIVAPRDAVNDLKREMATLGIVNTHYDFYLFFHDFMPREIRIRVNPDILNKIPADKRVFGNILSDNEA